MSIRKNCPCDIDGVCPYDATYNCDCEYWCGADEPEDERRYWDEIEEGEKIEYDVWDSSKSDELFPQIWNFILEKDLDMHDIEYLYTKIVYKLFVNEKTD